MSTETNPRTRETQEQIPNAPGDAQADLNQFQRDLLRGVQLVGGGTGQAAKACLEANGYQEINHGRLYPNLDTLVHKGLIEKEPLTKRANLYEITLMGGRALEQQILFLGGEI